MNKNEPETWYSLSNIRQPSSSELVAEAIVPVNSPWFSGHFPGEPILPGVAQLGMVYDAIKQVYGNNLIISEIKRIKFKQIIKPNEKIQIITTKKNDPSNLYSFKIMVDSQIACNGIMAVEKSN
jgi:3-hydroxymyristoyl/3-hydroxydecanoyl-(acyl carrier protein) dehydratase